MWKKFVDRVLLWMIPHLSCILLKIARHLKHRFGVCEICESCLCSLDKGVPNEAEREVEVSDMPRV